VKERAIKKVSPHGEASRNNLGSYHQNLREVYIGSCWALESPIRDMEKIAAVQPP
jgi:hypothetical protein